MGSLFSFLQFLASPVLGALSDVYGRKSILLFSMASLISLLFMCNGSVGGSLMVLSNFRWVLAFLMVSGHTQETSQYLSWRE